MLVVEGLDVCEDAVVLLSNKWFSMNMSLLSNQLNIVTLFPDDPFCARIALKGMACVERYKELRHHEKITYSIPAMFIDMCAASILR